MTLMVHSTHSTHVVHVSAYDSLFSLFTYYYMISVCPMIMCHTMIQYFILKHCKTLFWHQGFTVMPCLKSLIFTAGPETQQHCCQGGLLAQGT